MKRALTAGISLIVLVVFTAYASGKTPRDNEPLQAIVANTAAQPVPTIAQGTTIIDGTVALLLGTAVGIDPRANTVQLANSPSNPMFVQAAPGARSTPFQQTITVHLDGGSGSGSAAFSVPSGGTLVVENVSMAASETNTTVIGKIQTTVNGAVAYHFLPPFDAAVAGSGRPLTISEARRFYADGGSTVSVMFDVPWGFGVPSNGRDYSVTVSGIIE